MPPRYHIGASIPHGPTWRRILQRWHRLLRDYESLYAEEADDLPFWYNEPSNVSLLAGAVWREHPENLCLEELAVLRRSPGVQRRGRCDLWFRTRAFECWVEAKILWATQADDTLLPAVSGRLAAARRQLAKLQAPAHQGMQLCFVVPCLACDDSAQARATARAMGRRLRGVYTTPTSIFASHLLPPEHVAESKGRLYPGVFLVGRLQWPRG